MKIAIIGSGISGLTLAHYLNKNHDVTLYESANRLGGHTHTHTLKSSKKNIKVDFYYSIILKSDSYLSVIVKPSPGLLSSKSINPFSGAGSPSKI